MKIGIDLGGTNVRIGLVENGEIVKKIVKPTPADQPEAVVIDYISGLIEELMSPAVKGIGIGVPSVVDGEKGIVYNVANIPAWKEVHLKDILEKRFNVPVFVNNDSNCFALGEKTAGKGKPFKNMLGVTLGTGVGAGVIIHNELFSGSNTGAGEIGCIPYLEHNMEYYCSSNFFVAFHGITGKEAAQRASGGDEKALEIWKEFGGHMGKLVQTILYAYDPDAIIFGGGIASAYPYFEAAMRESLTDFDYPEIAKKLQILISEKEDIALLGAASLVRE